MDSSKIIWLIIIILSIFVQTSYAQNIDSLLNVRTNTKNKIKKQELDIQLAKAYSQKREFTEAEFYIDEALKLSQSLNDNELIALTYKTAGNIAHYKGEYQKADSIYAKGLKYTSNDTLKAQLYSGRFGNLLRLGKMEKGVTYLKKMRLLIGNDTTSLLMGEYYLNYSTYYKDKKDYIHQLQYLQKSKKIYLSHDKSITNINYNLAYVFQEFKDYENALKIHLEMKKKAIKEHRPYTELFALYGILSTQGEMKDYKAMKKTSYEAINLKNRTGVSSAFGYVYYMLGYAHFKTNQSDSAAYYFQKGIEISELQNEGTQVGDNHTGMAELYFQQGKFQEAKFHAEKANSLFSAINNDNNTILAKIYAKEGNYQKAYELLNINWSDAQKREEERTDYHVISSLLNDKFEQEKIQEQLLLQQDFNKQRQFLIGSFFIAVLILLAGILFIQTRNNRKLKQLNQQLHQQNNALQQFSYIASHDIKEPIRSIGNYIGLIRKKIADTDEKKLGLYFDNIKGALQQIYTLIEDVMQYTQVNQDEAIEFKEVNLNAVIKNIEVGLEIFIQEKGAKIIYNDLPIIKSSSSMLFIVLKNLIQNGIKFNRSDVPTVEIIYEKTKTTEFSPRNRDTAGQAHHQITISDNGIGIDEQYYEKVFEMFKRLNNKSAYHGSGIGLAIVKLSVEKLGGTIDLESEEGKGSRFTINLPQ
jgi:signal transduction histidine kinase